MKNTVIVSKEAAKVVKFFGSLRKAAAATGISASLWFGYMHGRFEPRKQKNVEAFLNAVSTVARACKRG